MKAIPRIISQYRVGLSLQGHKNTRTHLKPVQKNHSIFMHICLLWHPVNMQIHTAACKQPSKERVKTMNILKAIPIITLDYSAYEKYSSWKAGPISAQNLLLI